MNSTKLFGKKILYYEFDAKFLSQKVLYYEFVKELEFII